MRFEVDVLDVQNFQARLVQRRNTRLRICARNQYETAPGRVQSPIRIGEDVDLDLTHTMVELLLQRKGRVLEAIRSLRRVEDREQLQDLVTRLNVIAVVGAEHLNLIDAQLFILRVRRIRAVVASNCKPDQGGHAESNCVHSHLQALRHSQSSCPALRVKQ